MRAHPFSPLQNENTLSGPDYAKYGIRVGNDTNVPVDEIEDYWRGRYLSTGEAVWRIMGFNVTKKEPSVTAMSVHLDDDTTYQQYGAHAATASLSTLRHYFVRPHGSFTHHDVTRNFADLTYIEYFSLFRLAKFDPTKAVNQHYFLEQVNDGGPPPMHVILRSYHHRHYARIREVSNARGEVFYLRALLHQQPARSFAHLRTVNGVCYNSFQEAATAYGLFDRQSEAEYILRESIRTLKTPAQLRHLFVHLLIMDRILTPLQCWNTFQNNLCLDFRLRYPHASPYVTHHALQHLSNMLEEHGKHLSDYQLPDVAPHAREVDHELQKWAHIAHRLAARARAARALFNTEQDAIYNEIMAAVHAERPLLLFVDGKAGVGKSFLINVVCDQVRSENLIALPTATSAFAAQLYDGGRTLHSTFKVRDGVTHSLSTQSRPTDSRQREKPDA